MTADAPDYRDTLHLPRTEFPMRAGLPNREPAWLERWQGIGIYERLRQKTGRQTFVLHDGPPYANGHLHIGHALNKILKDIVVRSQQMLGKDALYVPGWDCHGLPIEWKIEETYRKQGKRKDDVPVLELRRECRHFAEQWIDVQRQEFERLGVLGDWNNPYLTMSFEAEAVIASEFMTFVMNGMLYRGSKPVLWSTVEQTALAQAEVEYHDRKDSAVWVRFPIAGDAGTPDRLNGCTVIIWTTTPWTLPCNRAVCFNPSISYGAFQVGRTKEGSLAHPGETLLVANALAASVMEVAGVIDHVRLFDVPTDMLAGLACTHPLRAVAPPSIDPIERWDFSVPLLPAQHVTDDAGTGFVHTAPSHGEDDYHIGLSHGLAMTHDVQADGRYRETMHLFGGLELFTEDGQDGTANNAVIECLKRRGGLLAQRRIMHSYPHSWRSKAPLIYRNTDQWFVAIDAEIGDGNNALGSTIRSRALEAIEHHVAWTPESGRNRLKSMMKERPDWVLSRQRAWGVPLTCFVQRDAESKGRHPVLRDQRVNARIIEAFRQEGADAWYHPDAKERFLGGLHDPDRYQQVFDILDVWFDSGSTHAFVLRDREDGPSDGMADLYLEGTDQHRGWFHSSLLQACGTRGGAPYRGVLTHGFTLDQDGRKMSKSIGNTIAPDAVVKQYGADILRLWVAQSDYTADQRIGPEILKNVADGYRRLRNCFRFMLGNLNDFSLADRVAVDHCPELERWVLHRTATIAEQVKEGYQRYDFQSVFQSVFAFATSDLSSFYFDIRKDVLYCDAAASHDRRAVQTILDILFNNLTRWLAPILVFTMDEVWLCRHARDDQSVHLQDFEPIQRDWINPTLDRKWTHIRSARSVVTAALETQRQKKLIGSSLEAAPILHVADPDLLNCLRSVPFHDICITSDIQLCDDPPPKDAFSLDDIDHLAVSVRLAEGHKCMRCWKTLPDVQPPNSLCNRCARVVENPA